MARGAVGGSDFAFFEREAVIAVGVGGQAVGGQIVAQCQARIAVAASAGCYGDILAFKGEPALFGSTIRCSP